MQKITELPQPTREDLAAQRELLAAQRVAIFGYDPCEEVYSNRIVQDIASSSGISFKASGNIFRDEGDYAKPRVLVLPGDASNQCRITLTSNTTVAVAHGNPRVMKDGYWCDYVTDSDAPAYLKALTAQRVKPAPEPVLSIGGSEFDSAELLEALQVIRARKAPAVKETPRGLMVVRELDHRLGLCGGEGC